MAQLTQRTNQFNTTTIRRQEQEVSGLLQSGNKECLAVEVSDRFGDYGLVGAAFFATEGHALVVDSLVLSCRALGRGVEQRVVAQLGAIAVERGLTELRLLFASTPKNQPAHRFLESLVARETELGGWAAYQLDPPAAAILREAPVLAAGNEVEPEAPASLRSAPSFSPFHLYGARADTIASDYATADAVHSRVVSSRRRSRPGLGTEYRPPNGDLEVTLTRLWSESLAIDQAGIDDDFFELGGTSLQAAMLANAVQGALKRSLGALSVFEAPTVRTMARLIGLEREPMAAPVRLVAGLGAVREGPLSAAQQRLWFLDQFNPGSVAYNEGRAIRLRGELDVPTLAKAFADLIARHEGLRTTFPMHDGSAVQRVEPAQSFSLPILELATGSHDEASRRVGEELARPFDLAAGPLFRAGLFRLTARDHVLWFVFHHIIADGSSVTILLHELAALYNARRAQRSPGLPELPMQYLDVARWQRDSQREESIELHRAYWKEQIAGKLTALDLPADRHRPAVLSYKGSRIPLKISEEVVKSLRELGRREQATLFMTLMATFNVLLFRHSGQEDVIVGFPIANRNRQELQGLIGFFVNTLPLRTDLSGNPQFTEVLRQVRRRALEAYAHQDMPFERLVDDLVPERDLARTPIFQVMVALLEDPVRSFDVPGLQCSALEIPVPTTRFDLVLNLEEGPNGLVGGLEFSTDLFDRDTIERLAGHLQTLLQSVIADPERPILALPMLSNTERRELLVQGSCAEPRSGGSSCLHSSFEAQAARTPDAVALVFEGTTVTYDALNRRANQLAHHLRSEGVKPDTLVGLCVDRSIEMVVGILGILKAGGAYVPLDPTYPPDRLQFLLEDSAVSVVVTQEQHLGSIRTTGPEIICLDRDASALASRSEANLDVEVAPEHLAYVIYTSGSTGKPKGVLVTHRNVARLFEATNRWYEFGPNDVWTLFHSFAFDFSVWELWGALLYGGRLVVVPYWVSRSPEAFHELLRSERVTVLNQTPSAFRQLIQADIASKARPTDMALRYVIFGGEALELQSLRPWFNRYGDAQPLLVNMYGITETTVHVTYRPITLADVEAGAGSIIGVPIPDLQIYVLDSNREPVPIGVTGEMYVGGAGLARGYLNRPELTEERFLANPFESDPSSRLYRTGDLARRLADGDLEYLGRIDQQVKIRGFRIELGEIEAAISDHPAVRETVVVARDTGAGEKQLVAYVALNASSPGTIDELRKLVTAKLPAHMVPAHFISLPTLPLTAHGKIDRKALPAPEMMRRIDRLYVAPRTPAEQTMADIWASVLRVAQVGIEDNFFELGGDSILSIQVIAKCRQNGLGLTPRDLFRMPTIAKLAAEASPSSHAPVAVAPVSGEIALTPIQRWFFERVGGAEVHHWNQAFLFETPSDLDVDLMERALQHVVGHHDAFRMRFTQSEAGWRQEYGPDLTPTIMRVDLSAVPASDQGAAITKRATALGAGLNVAVGPLLRVAHFDLGSGVAGRLLIAVHHLAIDGVSWRILLEDLELAYSCLREHRPVSLPDKTTSYAAWAQHFAAYASSEAWKSSRDHWRQVMEADVTTLPIDHPGGDNLEGTADVVVERLAEQETQALVRDMPTAYDARINEVLLTALARSLAKWTGGSRFRLELEGHGRELPFGGVDLSRTVGWFTTIYPVLLDVDPKLDDRNALRFVGQKLRRVPDQGISYALASSSHEQAPPIDFIFNYLGQFDQTVDGSTLFKFAAESAGAWHAPRARRTHAIEVLARIAGGRLEIQWIYSPTLHDRSTILQVSEAFASELRGLAQRATATVERLSAMVPDSVDRYPLTPMQRLFYTMAKTGYEAWRFAIEGHVDAARLHGAWQMLLDRHTILRTAFMTDGAHEPLQFVLRSARMPTLIEVDLQGMDAQSQEQHIRRLAQLELERGFDLSRAPLMRVALVRLADQRYEMMWSTHHLYIDGWSWPILMADLSDCYSALCDEREPLPPPACPYGRYVRWLADEAPEGDSFWRQELAGFVSPSPIDLEDTPVLEASSDPQEVVHALASDTSDKLIALARGEQTTASVVVQGAWALLLSHIGATEDIVFGAAYSGRPAEISGVEGMVGPCVNNIPVRVRVNPAESVADYVGRLQQRQHELSHHQFSPLARIQELAGVPLRLRLFESLIVFQNYVIGDASRRMGSQASLRLIDGPDATNYPLTLVVLPGPQMQLKLLYQPQRFTRRRVESLLGDLAAVLTAMAGVPERSVGSILTELPEHTRGRAARIVAQKRERRTVATAAPATVLEQTIASMWAELFQVERVGLDENFFDLGGHSLLLLEAHRRLQAQTQTTLPVVTLFQYPTVRSLSRFLAGEAIDSNARDVLARASRQKEALARMTRPRLGRR